MRVAVLVTAALVVGVACGSSRQPSASDEAKLGVEASRMGYWQEALFRFERARTMAPSDAEILNNCAVAFEALGRYDEALTTYKRALELAPKELYIRRNYARFAEFYTSYARGVRPKGDPNAPH